MTGTSIAASWRARRAAIMRSVDDWVGNGNAALRIGFACFLLGLPMFFVLNMLIFWFTPGLPFWGVCAFTVGTSTAIGAMNGCAAWSALR